MKASITSLLSVLFFAFQVNAQDKTTVTATTNDISDNLDLRAVATLFGDASNLEDFERRLNDPKLQISNLDLNNDNQVDYLRVIESVENNEHIIVVQAVLGRDLFQDVATVEVQRDRDNRVQVQVIGDVYMYGDNYIYEPVYVHTPVIYSTFWAPAYRPYCSLWYWDYYPTYFSFWNPCPIFRYRNNIALHINFGHSFYYGSARRCNFGYTAYYGRRANGFERARPNYSFAYRNRGYANRAELDNNRTIKTRVNGGRDLAVASTENTPRGTRDIASPRYDVGTPRNNPRDINSPKGDVDSPRTNPRNEIGTPRNTPKDTENPRSVVDTPRNNPRNEINTPRDTPRDNPRNNNVVLENPRNNSESSPRSNPRSFDSPRSNPKVESPRNSGYSEAPRSNPRSFDSPRSSGGGSRSIDAPRGNSGGNGGGRSSGRR
jgi:hypothetical protein